jgi:hypothetical protein
MNTKMQVLKADIEANESEIGEIFGKLATYSQPFTDPEKTIVIGYYLHNLYTAFEHLCVLVAEAFENQIDHRSQWHALLLRRMAQDIQGIRPKLIGQATYSCLDELRRFRHVFRSAYSITLDPAKLALVFYQAQELQALYSTDLEQFKKFLNTLLESDR